MDIVIMGGYCICNEEKKLNTIVDNRVAQIRERTDPYNYVQLSHPDQIENKPTNCTQSTVKPQSHCGDF